MTLPVSSYEALLVQVRELTHETILLQRQLSSDLYNNVASTDVNHNLTHFPKDYEHGKLLYDNVIRRCDKNIEIGQTTHVDRNEFVFHPHLTPSFDCVRENFSSGELTARLIAWKNENRQYQTEAEEETSLRRPKQSSTINTETTTYIPSIVRRVGVEGDGTPSLHSWEAAASATTPPTATREGLTIVRPYHAAGDPPLSNGQIIAEELQSAFANRVCPTSIPKNLVVPRSSENRETSRERWQSTRTNSRNHHHHHRLSYTQKNHEMDTTEVNSDNALNSGTSSPEYARTAKHYDEDGSSEEDSKHEDGSRAHRLSSLYHDTWPVKRDLWNSQQMSLNGPQSGCAGSQQNDMASVMSFSSSTGGQSSSGSANNQGHRRLGAKVDVVYSLLGMLGSTEGREDMSSTLLAMSNSIDSCLVMRQSGCLPLLVQLIHATGQDQDTRERASRALHNVVHARSDEKVGRREARVLRLLEQIRDYCQALRASLETMRPADDLERHPGPTIAALMKLSFDEAHRHAMCQLGGLHAVSELIEMDHASHGSESDDQSCITLRRYAGMALTNLTFGDGNNKALLCSFRAFMKALVSQLQSLSDDLRQVTASVLRNLSWRADSSSKQTLREVGAVTGLMRAAMEGRKESTLKSILSALWNLSAHCSTNKVDICAVDGALAFLVDMLSYKAPSKTLSIVENAGGILRNVSSHIAVREDYRKIVRERDCLQVLLRQLRSPSLTVVSNACGALWNLSARCTHDQRLLWDLGAVPMLRSLVHSKHKMISMGSSAALKNLLTARPAGSNLVHLDSTARGLGLPTLPTLVARRQRALEQEIDQNLAETCDNIEPSTSPVNKEDKFSFKTETSNFTDVNSRVRTYQSSSNNQQTALSNQTIVNNKQLGVSRSDSRESMRSVTSTHSDTIFERVNRHVINGFTPTDAQIKQQSSSLHSTVGFNAAVTGCCTERNKSNNTEKKYTLRYKNSIPERLRPTELGISEIADLRCTTSTMSWSTGPEQDAACSQILMNSSIEESISPVSSGKLSIGRCNTDFAKRPEDLAVRNGRINYKIPSVRSPIESSAPTLVTNCVETTTTTTTTSPCERTNEKEIQSLVTLGHTSDAELLEVYAETDLDQPTDYSLRYAEINSDDDDKRSTEYFAETEDDRRETIKNYCTPYETPLNRSGAASDNDTSDYPVTRECNQQKIDLGRIDDVAREMRRDVYREKKSKILQSDGCKKNSEALIVNRAGNNSFTLTNSFDRDCEVIESSESLPKSDDSIDERSLTSPCQAKSLNSGFEVDSTSEVDTAITRLNSLVLNDESKIINDSMINNNSELRAIIGSHNDSPDVDSSVDSMISDGDDDDEDLLAACIHIGMQNNRHRQSFRRNSLEKTPPAESNLARYQTSIALDQVEINGYTEQTSDLSLQTDSSRFNIKMSTTASTNDSHETDTTINGYASFEDNFNVAKDDDKITVEYQKLDQYSYEQTKQKNNDSTDGNITVKSAMLLDSEIRETRANSVEDNLIHVDTTNNVSTAEHLDSSLNRENHDSESMESFDSIERSEQALLQLCIKTAVASTNESVSTNETNSIFSNTTLTEDTTFIIDEDISTSLCVTETHADSSCENETFETTKLSRTRDNKITKNIEDEYRRQRDPDAMIASLDRLTATLVQQTEAMRERESSAMRQSVISDTWTEDSPNDVSYPSISVSAPLIASFKSDIDDDENSPVAETSKNLQDTENMELSCMTTSRIIESEAIRLSKVVSDEATRQIYGATSLTSNDLDSVRPPSTMDNIISPNSSYVGSYETYYHDNHQQMDHCQSNSLSPIRAKVQNPLDTRTCRKKSLPIGVVAKRALSHGINHAASIENLLNDCSLGTVSQLENIMPPSLMDELLDNGDMENSMLSVASITSECADTKDHDSNSLTANDPIFDLVQPVANVLSITCMRYASSMQTSANDSISEYLENVNPPSLLNEISDMDDSTIDANTDTMCSETLCIDGDNLGNEEISSPSMMMMMMMKTMTMNDDRIEEQDNNDTDDAATSITTESCYSSSAESTPKKRSHKCHLTPKQKRQLAKERFKTYTIAGELVKKDENERRKNVQQSEQEVCTISRIGKCSTFTRLTPKQRRQEDPARFQTQVLTNVLPDFHENTKISIETQECREENTQIAEPGSSASSSRSALSNLCGSRTFRKKRTDNKETIDRYRTRTLNCDDAIVGENLTDKKDNVVETRSDIFVEAIRETDCCETIQTMLEKNANIVLKTLNETSKVVDTMVDDSMLDCETLSLVSNDSESEHSLRMRLVVGGLGKKLMTNYVQRASQQAVERRQEETTMMVEDYNVNDEDEVCAREEPTEISDDDSDEDLSRNNEEQPRDAKRPRIVKPGTMSRDNSVDSQIADKSEPSSPKGIRGRRRALYSTPNTRKSTPQSSPNKQTPTGIPIGRSNTTPVVRSTRATTLRQNTNIFVNTAKDTARTNFMQKIPLQSTSMEKRSRNSVALSKRSSIPQRGAALTTVKSTKRHSTPPGCTSNLQQKEAKKEIPAATIKPLERQGTFTKDEPEVDNAPTVVFCSSPTKSKIAKPTTTTTRGSPIRGNSTTMSAGKSKISVKTQHQSFQQTRLGKCSSNEKISSTRVPTLASHSAGKRTAATIETATVSSVKCPAEQSNVVGTTMEIVKGSRRVTSLGQRSNSNSSIVSSTTTSSTSRKLPKEATSKIASLWKKVEDSKNKQKFEKNDTRQWITAPIVANDTTDSMEIPINSSKPPTLRLFRSSTFEGVPQESTDIVQPAEVASRPQVSSTNRIFGTRANFTKYRNSCDLTGMTQADAPCKIPVKFSDKKTQGVIKETPIGYGTIVLRKQRSVDSNGSAATTTTTTEIDVTKRISRLGSFISVEATESEAATGRTSENTVRAPISAIVSPFNYNPRKDDESSATTTTTTRDSRDSRLEEDDDIYDYQADIVTGSTRVTTV